MAAADPWAKRWPLDRFPQAERDAIPVLQEQMLRWQARHGRHGLPWHTLDPYGVWVSEVMLQQTQVSTGLYRYPAWMERFPTVESLASATQAEVLFAWEGLGYYARARNLHAAAKQVVEKHGGKFPIAREDRLALPGIGPSTASAIGAFAFGLHEAICDGNVNRVWARWWGDRPVPVAPAEQQRFWWGWAQATTPAAPEALRTWTQGIMDLGATVCTPRKPKCPECPWKTSCRAYALGTPEAWPVKAPKLIRKEWNIAWGWDVQDGRLAVVQRPGGGPWEGLWALPETSAGGSAVAEGKHDLSHRKIRWAIHSVPSSEAESRRVTRQEFEALALPRPLRRWWVDLPEKEREKLFGGDPWP